MKVALVLFVALLATVGAVSPAKQINLAPVGSVDDALLQVGAEATRHHLSVDAEAEAEAELDLQTQIENELNSEVDALDALDSESELSVDTETEVDSESSARLSTQAFAAVQHEVNEAMANLVDTDRVEFMNDPVVSGIEGSATAKPPTTKTVDLPAQEPEKVDTRPSPKILPNVNCNEVFGQTFKVKKGNHVPNTLLTNFETYLKAAEAEITAKPTIARIRDIVADRTAYTAIKSITARIATKSPSCVKEFNQKVVDLQNKYPKWLEVLYKDVERRNRLLPTERAIEKTERIVEKEGETQLVATLLESSSVVSNEDTAFIQRRFRQRSRRMNSLMSLWAGEFDGQKCVQMCNSLKNANTVDGGLAEQIATAINADTNVYKNLLSNEDKELLKQVILDDIVTANDMISIKIAEAVYTYEPANAVVNSLFTRFMALMEWLDEKEGKPRDTTAKTLFYPFAPRDVKANFNIRDNYGYAGDIGTIETNSGAKAIAAKGNMRVTLSLMYKAIYSNGRSGKQGIFTMMARAAKFLGDPTAVQKFKQLGLNVDQIRLQSSDNGGTVCHKKDASTAFMTASKPGWSMLKYICSTALNYKLSGSESKKTVPHQYSNSIYPPLSDEEVDLFFPPATPLTGPALLAYREEIRRYGLPIAWTCGGDGTFFNSNPKTALTDWFPRWARSIGHRLMGSASGTSDMLMKVADFFGLSVADKILLRAAAVAWMVPVRDHSYAEVMSAADAYDLPWHTYLTANKLWANHWAYFMVRPETTVDGIPLPKVDPDNLKFVKHFSKVSGAKCFTQHYVTPAHVQRRAGQLWFARVTSTPAVHASLPAPTDIKSCSTAVSALDMPAAFIAPKDRMAYVIAIGFNGFEGNNAGVYAYVFKHGQMYVSRVKMDLKSYLSLRSLKDMIRFDNFPLTDISPIAMNTPPMMVQDRGGRPCLIVVPSQVALCSHVADVTDRMKNAIQFYQENRVPIEINAHVNLIKKILPESHGAPVDSLFYNIEIAPIKTWLCSLKATDFTNPTIAERVTFLQGLGRCKSETLDTKLQAPVEQCLLLAFQTHTIQCNWKKSPKLTACAIDNAFIFEATARAVTALYSHQEIYKLFNRDVTPESPYFQAKMQEYFADTLVDPRTTAFFPTYDGMLFSGVSHASYATYNIGTTFRGDFMSFSRSIEVGWKFNKMRKDDEWSETPKPKPLDGLSSIYILVNTKLPGDTFNQFVGRQIYSAGVYGDDEQEITMPPATYRILSRRTMYAQCTETELTERKRREPCGPYVEIFIQLESVQRQVLPPHTF